MQQQSLYQANRQQLLMTAATIFGSIIAAVVVSTLLVMSLMRGEIASALSSNIQNSSPTVQTTGTCVAPITSSETETVEATATSAPAEFVTGNAQFSYAWPAASVNNSYNNTNTTTTTNNVTNTEVNTVIKDSFNDNSKHFKHVDNSKTAIIKDNTVTVDSNNNTAINSGNNSGNTSTTTNVVANVNSNNTTVASNNITTNSNNTVENHVLSDNTTVIAPLVALPL